MERNFIIKILSMLANKYLPWSINKRLEYGYNYIFNTEKYRGELKDAFIRKMSYGELNPNKKFYVVRADRDNWGILTTYLFFLDNIEWALQKGYIPVVDLKNYYELMNQDKEMAYKENAWDYYFVQPYPEYSLEEVYQSKNVVLGWKNEYLPGIRHWMSLVLTQKEMAKLHPIVKQYMDFRPEIRKRADAFWREHVPPQSKVLAVCMRAAFLRGKIIGASIYNNHPNSMPLIEWLRSTEQYASEWNCDYIFVSVEDREWAEAFKKKFGERCLILNRPLLHFFRNGEAVPLQESEYIFQEFQNVSTRKKTEDYLTEVCILSMCDSFFAQQGSAQTVASLHNGGKYEHMQTYFDIIHF